MALNDAEIRPALREWIVVHDEPTLVADELPVREGRARIDLASLSRELFAYEIKGQTDRLVRLKNQTEVFSKVCHRCTVVTTSNHLKKLPDHIPEWWGIMSVERAPMHPEAVGGMLFQKVRTSRPNQSFDYRSIALMLWKAEMLNIFEHYGHMLHERTPKSILAMKLEDLFSTPEELWAEVMPQLISRREDDDWAEAHIKI